VRTLQRFSTDTSWRSAIAVLLVASLVVPMIFASGFFFPYVAPRNMYFRVVIEIATAVLVWSLCFRADELDLRYEPIFWAVVLFVAAASVSALFSPASTHSFFGDYERMGGVWAWLHLALFFLLLRAVRDDDWGLILNAALIVSVLVATSAIGEHSRFVAASHFAATIIAASSSSVGNSGLLAAYLLFGVALAGYLAATSRQYRLPYLTAAAINLVALFFAENRSTVIGLVLGTLTGAVICSTLTVRSQRRWIAPAIAAFLACVVVSVSVAIRAFPSGALSRDAPGVIQRLALTNPAGSDESRTLQWTAALQGFEDRPLLGYGPENHNLAWSAHFSPEIYKLDTDIYDRTHNQFLEMLATTGLAGTVSFLCIWVAIGVSLRRAYDDDRISAPALAVLAGLQVAYATYLFFWFVDLNSTMLWILFAALIASRANPHGIIRVSGGRHAPRAMPMAVAFASALLLGAVLYSQDYVPIRANIALARIDSPSGPVSGTFAEFDELSSSPGRETEHTPIIMSQFLESLRPRFEEMRRDPRERRMLDRAFTQSVSAFEAEIHRDSLNDRLYTHEATLLMDAASFYESGSYLERAIDALHKAIELSPRRIQQRVLLAKLYKGERDFERERVVLGDAVKIDPDLGEPRYLLSEAYLKSGQSDSALTMLQSSLDRGYVGVPETYLAMGKRLEFSGRPAVAAKLYAEYLEAKYTRAVWEGPGTIDKPIPSSDIAVAAHLPLLYVRAQESDLAIKSAAALSAFDSSRSAIVARFVSDVGSRRRAKWIAKNSLLPCVAMRAARSADSLAVGACGVFRVKL
jgi:O-antigen ligase/tetratricopeptide (TPR) repeat protein